MFWTSPIVEQKMNLIENLYYVSFCPLFSNFVVPFLPTGIFNMLLVLFF